MAFNITIVAFGKEPDYSDEKLLNYRGFDPVLVGKETDGSLHFYSVKTEVPNAHILHVQTRDLKVESPNMSLVFENAFPEGITEDSPFLKGYQDRLQTVLRETMLRLNITDKSQWEGPWFFEGVMAFTFLNVGKEISNDLAKAERREIFKQRKPS
jgi:hypothetical protein